MFSFPSSFQPAASAEPAAQPVPAADPAPAAAPVKTMAIPAEVTARVGEPKSLEGASVDELKAILKEYYDK